VKLGPGSGRELLLAFRSFPWVSLSLTLQPHLGSESWHRLWTCWPHPSAAHFVQKGQELPLQAVLGQTFFWILCFCSEVLVRGPQIRGVTVRFLTSLGQAENSQGYAIFNQAPWSITAYKNSPACKIATSSCSSTCGTCRRVTSGGHWQSGPNKSVVLWNRYPSPFDGWSLL
jgi:hypothetical protein